MEHTAQELPPLDRVEQMVTVNKWCELRDALDGAIELQDALFMRPNAESFFSLAKLHKHGKIFRLSFYLSIYKDGVGEPLASISMTEDDLKTLTSHLLAAAGKE